MKATEIIARQNRVVYILLVLVAALGLVWTVWRHQVMAAADASAATPATQPMSSNGGR